MAAVSGDLDLSTADALTAIEDLGSQLDAVASAFGQSLADAIEQVSGLTVTVEADTAPAEGEIAALDTEPVDVPVEADVSDAESEIQSLDAEPVDVPVEVDPSAAEAGLADVSSAAQDTASSVGDIGSASDVALGSISALSGAAAGDLGSLSGAASGLGGEFAAVGAAAAGVAVPFQGFINDGLESISVAQRFALVTGDLADQIKSIDVGGLSGDLATLALSLGSDDEAALNAAASFVQFAQTSGASQHQIAQTSDELNALALRAVALNPSLGDVASAQEGLSRALARGGRFAAGYGLSLTSAEINARALRDTGKSTAAELSQFDKIAAGAAIATERLGNSLGTDFQRGSENVAFQVLRLKRQFSEFTEALGAAAVPEFIDTLEHIEPAAEGAASALGQLGNLGLQDLDTLVSTLQSIVNELDRIPGAAEAARAALHLGVGFDPLSMLRGQSGDIEAIVPKAFHGVTQAEEEAAQGAQDASDALTQLAQNAAQQLPTLGDAISNVDKAGAAFGVLNASTNPDLVIANLQSLVDSFENFTQNLSGLPSIVQQALAPLGPAVAGPFAEALASAPQATQDALVRVLTEAQNAGVDITSVLTNAGVTGGQGVAQGIAQGAPATSQAAQAAGTIGADSFQATFSQIVALTTAEMGLAGVAIVLGAPVGQARTAGIFAAAGFNSGISSMRAIAALQMQAAGFALISNAPRGQAFTAGQIAGQSFGSGFVLGINSSLGNIVGAATAAGHAAQAAASQAAGESAAIPAGVVPSVNVVVPNQVVGTPAQAGRTGAGTAPSVIVQQTIHVGNDADVGKVGAAAKAGADQGAEAAIARHQARFDALTA